MPKEKKNPLNAKSRRHNRYFKAVLFPTKPPALICGGEVKECDWGLGDILN